MPRAHEHFTVSTSLVTPFFMPQDIDPASSDPFENALAQLDILHKSVAQADTITGAWGLRSKPTPVGFTQRMLNARRKLCGLIDTLDDDQLSNLLKHRFFLDFAGNMRSGYFALRDYDARELSKIDKIDAHFKTAAAPDSEHTHATSMRMMAYAMLYTPAWKHPLVYNLGQLDDDLKLIYLRWLTTAPYLCREGDDAGYVGFTEQLLLWVSRHLDPTEDLKNRKLIIKITEQLDLGQLLLVDAPVRNTLEARNAVLEKIALHDSPAPRTHPRPENLSQGRIRIGILCRTFSKGPDSEAVVAFFKQFDQSRYEIFAYSVGFQDRVVSDDADFTRSFDATIHYRRILSSSPFDCREQILADDLDVFLYANATTFGIRELERALYHRVAPVQMVLNSHMPMALGFPSFDYYLTGRSDTETAEIVPSDYIEEIIHADGSVINYLNSLKPRPTPSFDRAALGLSDTDVVMMNGGSSQKLRYDCLKTMLRAVHEVPNGKLILAPYNPGWAARSQAFAFNQQLSEAAAEVGVSMDKIIVMGELSVAEAEAALSLSDIYLSSFPHGGATMTHLALIYGTPPVVLRRRYTKSIDQFLVSALGFNQMLASSIDDYVALASKLAQNVTWRQKLSTQMKKAAQSPVFVDNPTFSLAMQSVIQHALKKMRSRGAP